jgi:hypothetical protein
MKTGYYDDQKQWLADYKRQKAEAQRHLVSVMRWWRKRYPQFTDAKVVQHGWYGHCVMATVNHERQFVARVSDIEAEFERWRTCK